MLIAFEEITQPDYIITYPPAGEYGINLLAGSETEYYQGSKYYTLVVETNGAEVLLEIESDDSYTIYHSGNWTIYEDGNLFCSTTINADASIFLRYSGQMYISIYEHKKFKRKLFIIWQE